MAREPQQIAARPPTLPRSSRASAAVVAPCALGCAVLTDDIDTLLGQCDKVQNGWRLEHPQHDEDGKRDSSSRGGSKSSSTPRRHHLAQKLLPEDDDSQALRDLRARAAVGVGPVSPGGKAGGAGKRSRGSVDDDGPSSTVALDDGAGSELADAIHDALAYLQQVKAQMVDGGGCEVDASTCCEAATSCPLDRLEDPAHHRASPSSGGAAVDLPNCCEEEAHLACSTDQAQLDCSTNQVRSRQRLRSVDVPDSLTQAAGSCPSSARSVSLGSHAQSARSNRDSSSSKKPPSGVARSSPHASSGVATGNVCTETQLKSCPTLAMKRQPFVSPASRNRERASSARSSSSLDHEAHSSRKPVRSQSPLRARANHGTIWKVVGGAGKGGIIVREGYELSSQPRNERLSSGALVEEEEIVGERLRFSRLTGRGPDAGWVSINLKDKSLLVRVDACDSAAALPESARSNTSARDAAGGDRTATVTRADKAHKRVLSEEPARRRADNAQTQPARRGYSCELPPTPLSHAGTDKLPRINLSRSAPPTLAKQRSGGAEYICHHLPPIARGM